MHNSHRTGNQKRVENKPLFFLLYFFLYICNVNNNKPTFASIGKVDDPYKKSKGGRWILLLGRPYSEDDDYVFNFDPDTIFYSRRKAYQDDYMNIVRYGQNWKFLRGHEK